MVSYVVEECGESNDGFVVFCARCVLVKCDFAGVDAERQRHYAMDMRWVVRGVVAGHADFHVCSHRFDEDIILRRSHSGCVFG